jgi:Flp pilus assembly protein TadD
MKKILLLSMGGLLLICVLISCTTKNIENQKALSEASRSLGEAYLRQGRIRAALKELKKAEELNPTDFILQDDLGLAYLYLGNEDRAIFHFKKALELNENYTPARNNLGHAYAENKEWQ